MERQYLCLTLDSCWQLGSNLFHPESPEDLLQRLQHFFSFGLPFRGPLGAPSPIVSAALCIGITLFLERERRTHLLQVQHDAVVLHPGADRARTLEARTFRE